MENSYFDVLEKVDSLNTGILDELRRRHIDKGFIAYSFFSLSKELSGKLSSLGGFVKCILDSGCVCRFIISKKVEDSPLDETNIRFESLYTKTFSLFDVTEGELENPAFRYLLPVDSKNKIRKVDENSLSDLSNTISVIKHNFTFYTDAYFDCIHRYLHQIDTSLIGKTENTKNLENADKVASIIKEAQELSSRLIELGKSVEDLHVYYS